MVKRIDIDLKSDLTSAAGWCYRLKHPGFASAAKINGGCLFG